MSAPDLTAVQEIAILRARVRELEEHQREDVAAINHASDSLRQATETIRRYQMVFNAAQLLQERFGAVVATYDEFGNPTESTDQAEEAIYPAALALWVALDSFEIPAQEEVPA